MRMKTIYYYAFAVIIAVLALSGCSSKAVKHEVVEVKIPEKPLPVTVVESANILNPRDYTINYHAYQYYIDGLILEEMGDYKSAEKSFKRALQYHPNSYQLRYSLAETYYNLREYHNVIELLDVIKPVDLQVLKLLGSCYLTLGMPEEAMKVFHKTLEIDSDNIMAYTYLSSFFRHRGETDSLIWAYENLTRIRPGDSKSWQELGRLHAKNGRIGQSKETFKKALSFKSNTTNVLLSVSLGELYMMEKKYDSALYVFEKIHRKAPDNLVVNRELASLYLRTDSLEAALPYALKVSELSPLDKPAKRRAAIVYYGLDSLNQSDSIFTTLVNDGDKNLINHFYLGRIAILKKEYNIAVDEFKISTEIDNSITDNWLDLAYAYRFLEDSENEILTYQTSLNHIKDESDAIKIMFSLGAAYEHYDKYDDAVNTFEKIIDQDPENSKAMNYLGYILAVKGEKLEYARDLIEKAMVILPGTAAYIDSYGWVLFKLGNNEEALKHLLKAAELSKDAEIFDHIGDVYKDDGDTEKALVWWNKALELDSTREEIREKIGN